MNRPAQQATLLIAVLAMTAAGCTQLDRQSWGPVSDLMPRRYSAETKFKVARVEEKQGQLTSARKIYSELHRRDPNNGEVCQRLAVVSSRLGDTQEAERYFNEALRLAPNRADVLTDYGYAKLMNKDYATAESLFRRAIAIEPANKRATNNLAIALGYQGKHEQALAMFRRVVPEAQAQANLAYLHVQRGEGKLAVDGYTKAVSLDKDLHSAAHALLQLADMEQRFLRSERGRQQLARLKDKQPAGQVAGKDSAPAAKGSKVAALDSAAAMNSSKVAADKLRSTEKTQHVEFANVVGSKPTGTNRDDRATASNPRSAEGPARGVDPDGPSGPRSLESRRLSQTPHSNEGRPEVRAGGADLPSSAAKQVSITAPRMLPAPEAKAVTVDVSAKPTPPRRSAQWDLNPVIDQRPGPARETLTHAKWEAGQNPQSNSSACQTAAPAKCEAFPESRSDAKSTQPPAQSWTSSKTHQPASHTWTASHRTVEKAVTSLPKPVETAPGNQRLPADVSPKVPSASIPQQGHIRLVPDTSRTRGSGSSSAPADANPAQVHLQPGA